LAQENRVFETLASFRAAAWTAQRLLAWTGLAAPVGCALAAVWGLVPAWAIAVATAPLGLSIAWGIIWRRRLQEAFWQGARLLRRGRPVRLPLGGLLLALAAALLGASAPAGESPAAGGEAGAVMDLERLLQVAGIGGWIALAMGGVALLVALYLLFSLWSRQFAPRSLRAQLIDRLSAGDVETARKLCSAGHGLLARSVAPALPAGPGRIAGERELPAARIEAEGRRGAARWRALVDLLAVLGLLAPVAGLFGTVLGLIEVFSGAAGPEASTSMVAAGAVSALVPAAIGMGTSLFSLSAHYLADLRLGSLVAKCEAACLECSAALADHAAAARRRPGRLGDRAEDNP
jgi:biopolymer transport protein ExbB